jgi:hypothetical protein
VWPELPQGKTVLKFSPGGGPWNDGLSKLEGYLYATGNCDTTERELSAVFRADGNFLGEEDFGELNLSLPDHVDEVEMTIQVTYLMKSSCAIGLSWQSPSIERNKPVAAPSPSPTPS